MDRASDVLANSIDLKRGDTISLQGIFADEGGWPIDLTGYQITSQIRTSSGQLVGEFQVTAQDQAVSKGCFDMTVQSDETWPLTRLLWDLRYIRDGICIHTDTVYIDVKNSSTR